MGTNYYKMKSFDFCLSLTNYVYSCFSIKNAKKEVCLKTFKEKI